MSEPAAEAGRAAPRGGQGSGLAFLSRKFGGFPLWVYAAVLAGLLAWRYVASKSAGTSASSTTSTGAAGTSADTSQAPSSTDASQVPQFVNQTYTTLTPPTVPQPSNPAPTPPGVPGPVRRPPQPVALFPKPTGLKATNPSRNGVTLTWNTVPAGSIYPPSYTVAIYNAKGRPVSETTVDTPDATKRQGTVTLTGLPSGQNLHANVWPNGGQHAPQNASVPFKTAA